MIPSSALDDLRRQNPVPDIAGKWVSLRAIGGRAGRYVGPCPLCSDNPTSKTASRFECEAEKFVCAVCCKAGDVIKLVMEREGKDFRAAVEWLGGAADDADPEEEARRAAERAEKKRRDAAAENRFREDERKRLYDWWNNACPITGTPAEAYLLKRGLLVPRGVRLRYRVMPMLEPDGKDERGRQNWRVLHSGPAMLAAITAPDGHFIGLHITWIDLSQPKGKAEIVHPDTGEVIKAKKMRGTKAGGQIELVRCAEPWCLIIGEGIETVLSVYTAMVRAGMPLEGMALWSAGDLGNLAGPAAADSRVRHPTAKDKAGKAKNVPGSEPNLDKPAVLIPASVRDLRLLADGDSDPFATGLVMERAAKRHAHRGRKIHIAWPAPGCDFNDMLGVA